MIKPGYPAACMDCKTATIHLKHHHQHVFIVGGQFLKQLNLLADLTVFAFPILKPLLG